MTGTTPSPSGTARLPPGQKSFCTSTTSRTSRSPMGIGSSWQVREPARPFRHTADERAGEVLRVEQAAVAGGALQQPTAGAPGLIRVGAEGAAPMRMVDL